VIMLRKDFATLPDRLGAAAGFALVTLLAVFLALLLAGGVLGGCGREGDSRPTHEEAGGTGVAPRTDGVTGGQTEGQTGGQTGETTGEPPRTHPACGPVEPWDGDGDGISDTVEVNNAREGYLPFDPEDCDEDPSRPEGTWYDGVLNQGVNLTDKGAGYVHNRGSDPVDGDDWGALKLVQCIEAVGRAWEGSDLVFGVNDMSLRQGHRFQPHRSHQNGLDADLRYVRRDGGNAPLDLRRNPEDYDAAATQELLRLFLSHCEVEQIFVDLDSLSFGNGELGAGRDVLTYAPGHSNHFHLRLAGPGGAR